MIRNRLAFLMFSVWHFRAPMQAGEYLVDRPLNSREMFWKLAKGQIFVHTVIIPEGWTMYDIAGELDRQSICQRDDFLAAAHDTSLISDLAPQAQSLEGFLFPSTYEFTRHTTCEQVAKRMVQNFRAVWESLAAANSQQFPQGLTSQQVVSLASLVERETPNPNERPLVAGVFYNRLRLGDPLQCDPTVQYALELSGRFERNIRPADLHVDSPYNTYEHRGLPPGPIANPGEASLRAALFPATTDYMYFVANARRRAFIQPHPGGTQSQRCAPAPRAGGRHAFRSSRQETHGVKAVNSHRPKERARGESSTTKKALILELARRRSASRALLRRKSSRFDGN